MKVVDLITELQKYKKMFGKDAEVFVDTPKSSYAHIRLTCDEVDRKIILSVGD